MTGDSVQHDYLHEAMQADYDASKSRGRGAEWLANHFGMSAEWVYKCVSGERPFPLHRIGEWKRVTSSDHAARWVAAELGLAFVPMPTSTNHTLRELTEMVEANTASLVAAMEIYADGEVDREEATNSVPICQARLRKSIESQLALLDKLEHDKARALDGPTSIAEFERMAK